MGKTEEQVSSVFEVVATCIYLWGSVLTSFEKPRTSLFVEQRVNKTETESKSNEKVYTRECCMIRSIACLIPYGPYYNTGMIFVPFNHADHTIQHGSSPTRFLCRMLTVWIIKKTMCLDIGLIDHVHAKQITQLIPALMLRIMAVPDSINIVLFHQNQILQEVTGYMICLQQKIRRFYNESL